MYFTREVQVCRAWDVSQARYTLLYFYKFAGARQISINFAYTVATLLRTTERIVYGVDQKSNAIQTYPLSTVIWGGGGLNPIGNCPLRITALGL